MYRQVGWRSGAVFLVLALWTSSAFSFIAAPPAAAIHRDTKGQLTAYARLDWNSHASGKNRISHIFKQDVYNIVKTLLGDDAPDGQIFARAGLPPEDLVQEYQFLDIDHAGQLALVLVIGDVCSSCPNRVAIVKPVNGTISMYEIEDEYASLKSDIVLSRATATAGVLSRRPLNLESAAGSTFVPWVDVYSWNGENYVLSNNRFKDYYATAYTMSIKRMRSEQESLANPPGSRDAQLSALFIRNLNLALARAAAIR